MVDYVAGFAFSPDLTRIILIKKKRPAWQLYKINGIGGKIEPNETPEEAMAREFREETILQTESKDWKRFIELRTCSGEIVHFFLYRFQEWEQFWSFEQTTDENVFAAHSHMIPNNCISNLEYIIPLAKHISANLLYDGILLYDLPIKIQERIGNK